MLTRSTIKITRAIFLSVALLFCSLLQAQKLTSKEYKEDFAYFWKTVKDNYAYFDKKQTDWDKVKVHYEKALDTVTTTAGFVPFLEAVYRELYDDHASLNTNTLYSRRLVPSGTDIWAEYFKEKAIITAVRKDCSAERAGLIAGMEVIAVNDMPVSKAIVSFLPTALKADDPAAHNYALRLLLAGNHIQPRKLTVKYNNKITDHQLDSPKKTQEADRSLLTSSLINGIGYIRINNCLFDNNLIPAFDSVMLSMRPTKALILDLRDTPSGGNTTVARTILSWFITKEQFYQKHELPAEETSFGIKRSWMEIVSPRTGKHYSKPLIVLADRWTGSVGEGITIAFDGMKRATIVGTPLAGLNGAIYSYRMPHTKIGFSLPVEKLYHINGQPREEYRPTHAIDLTKLRSTIGRDPVLEKAVRLLKQQEKK